MATTNGLNEGAPLRVEMWGDIQCSWCYIQREILKLVIVGTGGAEMKFRTYSQFPHVHTGDSPPDDCFREYREVVGHVAAEMGLGYDCVGLQRTDSQRAHELVHFAAARGQEAGVVDRLYRAHFAEGLDVGDLETIGDIAAQCDLDRNEATAALQHSWCRAEVEQDNHLAYLLGVPGVPFMTINGRYSLRGVHTPSALREILAEARRSRTVGGGHGLEASDHDGKLIQLTGETSR